MTDEQKTAAVQEGKVEAKPEAQATAESKPEEKRGERGARPGGQKPRRPRGGNSEPKEFEESILQIDRVTRVTRGGRQLRFRISVVIGDKKGRVGFGIGKSSEVLIGIQKAVSDAKRNLITVPCFNGTIPHQVDAKFKSSKVFLLPAQDGTGVIAGGAVRKILELSGVNNVLSKMHGSRNKINSSRATFNALKLLAKEAPHTPKGAEKVEAEAPAEVEAPKKETKAEVKKAPAKKAPAKKPAAKKADK